MTLMKISQKGVELIKKYEGCQLTAYRCPAGVLTIGFGNTKHAKQGVTITLEQAEQYLKEDIAPIEKAINALNINFKQGQFDALVSWCFNLGLGNFKSSTMRKYIVAKKSDIEITDQMVKWHNTNGRPLLGLKRRRVDEANLWLGYVKYYIDSYGNIKKK